MLLPLNAAAEEHHGHGVVVRPFVGGWYAPDAGAYWGPFWDPYWSVPYPVTPFNANVYVPVGKTVRLKPEL
jgi:hypothetical protein